MKALFILENLITEKHFVNKKAAMDAINPNHLDKRSIII